MVIVIRLVLFLSNIVFVFVLFVLLCIMIFVITQLYFLFVHFPVLRFSPFESLSVVIAYMLNFFCHSFVGFAYVYYLVHQSVVVFCFVFRHRSAVQFFVFVNFSNFLQCSLCILICECICLFLSVCCLLVSIY